MSAPDPQALGVRAEAMLTELGAISAEPGRRVRLFLTPEHRRAADLVAQWMREAGLAVSEDALGTVKGRTGEGRRLLIGSHIDTVIDAGKYDGPFGVVTGILAAEHFIKAGQQLPFGIDGAGVWRRGRLAIPLDAFVGLGVRRCVRSRHARSRRPEGHNLCRRAEGLWQGRGSNIRRRVPPRGRGRGTPNCTSSKDPCRRRRTNRSASSPASADRPRLRVTVTGEAGHAGTVPMGRRHDALAGAAEMAMALEAIAREQSQDGMVADGGAHRGVAGRGNIIPASGELHHRPAFADRRLRLAALEKLLRPRRSASPAGAACLFDGDLPRDRHRALRAGVAGRTCCGDHNTGHRRSACRPARP